MVERTSEFGAFPTVAVHPFVQEEEPINDQPTTIGSGTLIESTNNDSSLTPGISASDEDTSWSDGVEEEKLSEDDTYEEIESDDDDDHKEDELGLKGVESYEDDLDDHLESVSTDDGSMTEGPLLWRMNPKNSWSDWKLIVSSEEDGANSTATTYHVHKALLASGPRRSRFFRRIFRTDEVADKSNNSCTVQLPHLSVQAFPLFLDLLYDQSIRVHQNDPEIRKHAVALYHLADIYQVNDLVKELRLHFIPKIGLEDACPYYLDAVAFDPPIRSFLDHILKVCTSNVLCLDPTSPLLRAMEPEFLLAILETERRRRETRVTAGAEALHISRHLSTLIVGYVAYCDVEEILLEDRMLEILTRTEYIPSIDFCVVLEWSRMVIPKILRMQDQRRGSNDDSSISTSSSDSALNIQLRCLESIKDNITKVHLDDSTSEYRDFLKSLPADIAVDAALELTMLRQHVQLTAIQGRNAQLQDHNDALEADLQQLKEEFHTMQQERKKLSRDLSRFELLLPSSGRKTALKKVPRTPPASTVPEGVKMSTSENGHLQVNGRPLFCLRPASPPNSTGGSGSDDRSATTLRTSSPSGRTTSLI